MRPSGAAETRASRAFWIALVGILALAAAVRVVKVGDLPAGFFCDEAGNGYNSYLLLTTGRDETNQRWPLYVWSFGVSYKNPVFIYAATLPIALFGLSEFSVRLTAAMFGVLGVLGIGLLGRVVFGAAGGLIAALLLAVVPWHVHFSRIAFELIAFPALFLLGFAALAAGVRGRPRWLLVAGPLFALSLYAYGPAKLFVPLFLLGAALVYARRLWAVRGMTALAILLTVIVALPVVVFDLNHRELSGQYFSRTTTLNAAQTVQENAARVWDQYQRFFSSSFLFERGDPLLRHAVPNAGELYRAMLPLLALGVLWCLWPGHPDGKLFLWWLVLYPIAPAMMNEAPSASRGFIGVAGFCLVAAAGAVAVLNAIAWLLGRWPRVVLVLQTAAVLALIAALGREAVPYARSYVDTYPAMAASEFQYGYRETIQFMEGLRPKYDLLLLTANRVNQPQIFAAFYNAERPGGAPSVREHGYLILDPAEYGRYEMNQRILAALREDDLRLFDDYTELHRVKQPSGRTEFVIAEVRHRKRFLREWLVLGPFDNSGNTGMDKRFIEPTDLQPRAYDGAFGQTYWRRVLPQFVRVDLNAFYRQTTEAAQRPLDWLCAYAMTQLDVTAPQHAMLELGSAGQSMQAWVNGRPLTERMVMVSAPQRWPIQLQAGANEVLLKICKTQGEWFFTARVTDLAGKDLPDVTVRPALRPTELSGAPAPPAQLVDGFGAAVRASRISPLYADYRGDAQAWWEALEDPNGAVVWNTDPVPASAPTGFIFTATMGDHPGEAELYVNGRYALRFPTGRFPTPQRWQRGPYVLEYVPRQNAHFLSGYWRLQVPAEDTTPGRPVELRVAHVDGSPFAFFQIKGREDTAQFEGVTLETILVPGADPTGSGSGGEAPAPAAAAPPAG
jgi:4-amino-4-deoxy-L-arabinose transferase-like glycosyltransferase